MSSSKQDMNAKLRAKYEGFTIYKWHKIPYSIFDPTLQKNMVIIVCIKGTRNDTCAHKEEQVP
jgi:hypothetical protein